LTNQLNKDIISKKSMKREYYMKGLKANWRWCESRQNHM